MTGAPGPGCCDGWVPRLCRDYSSESSVTATASTILLTGIAARSLSWRTARALGPSDTEKTTPAGFTAYSVSPNWIRGASVWSSLAYCAALDRVYVGTGNPSPDSPAPDALYSSGCISLDAITGQFKGFWSPQALESYWPSDNDIDVPGGPIVYRAGQHWRVAIGSKSGAFVILDADTMGVVARRQDAWPTVTDAFGITRYSNTSPPMYTSPPMSPKSESGLGSAAVVNDVVFACTGQTFGPAPAPASVYAFDVETGVPLWGDHAPLNAYCLGAAIYGNYVVIGAGATVRRYHLPVIWFPWPWLIFPARDES